MAPVQVAEAEYPPVRGAIGLGGGTQLWLEVEDCLAVGLSKGSVPVVVGRTSDLEANLRFMVGIGRPARP